MKIKFASFFPLPATLGICAAAPAWAYLESLPKGKLAIQKTAEPKVVVLYLVEKEMGQYPSQFVRLYEIPPAAPANFFDAVSISGKKLVSTYWIQFKDPSGNAVSQPVPLLWLPVNEKNQATITAEFYLVLHRGPREKRFLFPDLTAKKTPEGNAFFAVVNYDMANANSQRHQFVVYRHAEEKTTFTGAVLGTERRDGIPEVYRRIGYTVTTHQDEPRSLTGLVLKGEHEGATSRGDIRAASELLP